MEIDKIKIDNDLIFKEIQVIKTNLLNKELLEAFRSINNTIEKINFINTNKTSEMLTSIMKILIESYFFEINQNRKILSDYIFFIYPNFCNTFVLSQDSIELLIKLLDCTDLVCRKMTIQLIKKLYSENKAFPIKLKHAFINLLEKKDLLTTESIMIDSIMKIIID